MQILKIECDAQPFLLFTEVFESFLERIKRPLDLGNLSFELVRLDTDYTAASAGKLIVRLYPSDAFLSFAGAIFAGDLNFCAIEKVSHD